MSAPTRVLICGTGSGAHVLAAVISRQPDVEVRVITQSAEKAQRWRETMDRHGFTVTVRGDNGHPTVIQSGPFTITSERQAARGCDIVILSVPAFAHRKYLTCLAPYLEDGCVIVGLPGQNGFEFDVREALGPRLRKCVIVNFDSLPWVCRTNEFGRSAGLLSTKERLVGAMQNGISHGRVDDPLECLQRLFGERPKVTISGSLLGITLRSPNGYCHPPLMFGRWKEWDGRALDEPPLLYHGVDEATAALLEHVSDEIVATSRQIMAGYPDADLSQVISLYDWDVGCYSSYITDKTNLITAMRTNAGYAGLTHPMIETADGKYVPDFNHRFLTEDVPFGLVVIRGVAEIADVPTPFIDTVLCWCQETMGKEYLVGSRLTGKDIGATRCPQRYGLTTMEDILGP
jgi:NAD/NADP octopine/nopaline dehydrogenase, alpha-helical domain/Ketopantoate reductase PanE/ApbA